MDVIGLKHVLGNYRVLIEEIFYPIQIMSGFAVQKGLLYQIIKSKYRLQHWNIKSYYKTMIEY